MVTRPAHPAGNASLPGRPEVRRERVLSSPTTETAQTIARNTTLLVTSDIVTKLFLFLYTVFIARYLGTSGFGIIAFALAFTGLFTVFADMGLGLLTTREVARDKSMALRYLSNGLSIKLVLAVVTYGAMVLTINLMDYPHETVVAVYIAGLSVICAAFAEFFNSLFMAFERMKHVAIGRIINAAAVLVGALLVMRLEAGVVGVALVFLVASSAMLVYNVIVFTVRFLVPKLDFEFGFWKALLKEGWPFGFFAILGVIATRIDIIMLSAFKGDHVVGQYEAAVTVAVALQFVPVAVVNSFFPKLSEYSQDKEMLESLSRKMNRVLVVVAVLFTTGMVFFAGRAIPLIYGAEFNESIVLLQILSPYVLLTCLPADGIVLNAVRRQRAKFYASVVMVITNVVLNLIFIPKYGAIAAAGTTILSHVVLRVLYIVMVRMMGLKTFSLDFGLVLIVAGGIGSGYVFGQLLDGLNLFLSIFMCAGTYLAIAYFGFARKEEREFINSSLMRSVSFLRRTPARGKTV